MSKIAPITVNVDEALALDKYEVDEANAHIEVDLEGDLEEFLKLVRVCPAALYKIDEEGNRSFDYAGCLECGTCRIACGDTIIKKWENPQPTMGVEYRFGTARLRGMARRPMPPPFLVSRTRLGLS